ncbi:nucleoside-diphosphate sugar epimerase/dehydratase [Herbaspirillum sp. YR522]|uniref:polysaccharide biosynthesis protein n=1 Tax=Herbaspirillum sp. YR522 TaxID=1144342 RepID=UPI00026F9140|nr:nucleoside-diphosphate sugar epimerase/dehydratase [Herbaspirillum sp. YR522]EJN00855.1 putative nucleoside-diphosphate sugar epimerase [Herbaspirillum sp. YR522]
MRRQIIHLPRRIKQGIVIAVDLVICLVATWTAFSIRLDTLHFPEGYQWHVYQVAPLLMMPIFVRFGLYRAVFRYTGIAAIVSIAKAVAVYGLMLFLFLVWLALPGVPRSLGVLQPLLLFSMIGGSRAFARLWLSQTDGERKYQSDSRMLIYGAGAAGAQIADVLQQRRQFTIIGFLDDNAEMHGKLINGLKVYPARDVGTVIQLFGVTDVLMALPTVTRTRRNEILDALRHFHVHVSSLPDLTDLARGKVRMSDIHELDIVDLLGRDPVPPNLALISRNILDKVVLVTGAGGSIGSELCRQILPARPSCLLLLDHNEYSLYAIHRDLQERVAEQGLEVRLIPLLGSVKDFARLAQICRNWRPRTIYHAAAYKHVPLVEHNPAEGIRNNVFGTLNVARAALESGVQDMVLISTDKAVRPTNVMGATKRLAEMILQALASSPSPAFSGGRPATGEGHLPTRFSMVRFGNVLDSSGSVVPLFRQQIKNGGPITLTDLEVTRYFMTIPEAAQLVIQAGAMAEGGDVFLLDMGQPVRILDLARRMVELSGLTVRDQDRPDGDIEIQVTGLRPGEKLFEELLIEENAKVTAHPRIMCANEQFLSWPELQKCLDQLAWIVEKNDVVAIRTLLTQLVTGYLPAADIVDWIDTAVALGAAGPGPMVVEK